MFKSSLCLLGRNTEAVAKLNGMLGVAAQGSLVGADRRVRELISSAGWRVPTFLSSATCLVRSHNKSWLFFVFQERLKKPSVTSNMWTHSNPDSTEQEARDDVLFLVQQGGSWEGSTSPN